MGTEFVVYLPSNNGVGPADVTGGAVDIALEAMESLDGYQNRWSVFEPTSDISRFNSAPIGSPVSVSPGTLALVRESFELTRRTDGAFDVTAGALIDAWGFSRRQGRRPDDDDLKVAFESVGIDKVQCEDDPTSMRKLHPDVKINLGAIGKGAALDRLGRRLRNAGVDHFLIHGGASSVLAAGNRSPEVDDGWIVGISHPTVPGRTLIRVRLKDAAIGTSGSGKQFFHERGKRVGHVLDPRTGRPAGTHLARTVLTRTATEADAIATALFVMDDAEVDAFWKGDPQPPMAMWTVDAMNRQNEVSVSRRDAAATYEVTEAEDAVLPPTIQT